MKAQLQSLVSLFLREQVAASSSTQQRYVTGKAAKGSALPAFQPHPPAFVSQLTKLRKPLPSVLQVFFSSHHCFGPPCCAVIRAPALQLCYEGLAQLEPCKPNTVGLAKLRGVFGIALPLC